jgi:competence protein ComEA
MENQYLEKARNWWSDLHYSATQKRALALVALLVLLSSGVFVARGASQEVVAAPIELEVQAITQEIIVDVAGAVTTPGVYSLPINSRVVAAIKAAGGIKKGADTSDINQARILKDGEQIYVYPAATSSSGGVAKRVVRKNGPVMINRATVKEFEALDGIGPVLANRIVAFRKINGPFTVIEDVMKVSGIGAGTFAKFKEKLRV